LTKQFRAPGRQGAGFRDAERASSVGYVLFQPFTSCENLVKAATGSRSHNFPYRELPGTFGVKSMSSPES
jgi:hypothetical protein